jgi:hypothetical protein
MNRNPIGHVATRLLREIEALVRIGDDDREKPILIIEEIRAVDWASLTFVGQRHELDLRLDGERDAVAAALIRLVDDLAERDIPISGHFIADIRIIPGDARDAAPPQPGGRCCQPLSVAALVLRD